MSLIHNQWTGLQPLGAKQPNTPAPVGKNFVPDPPLMAAQPSQARVTPITPFATTAQVLLGADAPLARLRAREGHELQALLRNMQGIEPPKPTGENVDLLVPRPTRI